MQRMTYFSAYLYKLSFPDSAECVKNSFTAEYCKNYFLLVFCVVVFFADDVVPVFVVFADCFFDAEVFFLPVCFSAASFSAVFSVASCSVSFEAAFCATFFSVSFDAAFCAASFSASFNAA